MKGPTPICGSPADPKPWSALLGALARLAAAQHGVVSRGQLLDLGFNESAIKRRIATGLLIRVQRNVYAVGHARLTPQGRWMAAVLTYGDGALLSHRSAAALWGLLRSAATKIDVTIPKHRRQTPRSGIRLHHALLHPADYRAQDAIPVTSPMRTLLDLGDVASPGRIREAFEASLRLELFDLRPMTALLERSPGRRGLKPLRELLAEAADDPPDLRSVPEREFLELIRAAGLPMPATNVVVEGLLVDAFWPRHGLVVELDSYGYHRSRAKFEDDHERTERLQNAGLGIRRFTARRIHDHPRGVLETVRRALAGGGGPGA